MAAVTEKDDGAFAKLAEQYVAERKKFLAQLSLDDHKYFSFQLWQEGIARYTQIMAAKAAASYRPTAEFGALPHYELFAACAAKARNETIDELKSIETIE